MESGASPLGAALQGAGRQASAAGLDILTRRKTMRDRTAVLQGVTAWQASETERFREAQNAAPLGAPDFATSYMEDYEQRVAKAAEAMPSPEAAAAFTERALSLGGGLRMDAMAFEAKAFGDARRAEVENALSLASNVLVSDPSQYEATRARLMEGLEGLEGALPAQALADLRTAAEQQLSGAYVSGLIEADPAAARQVIESGDLDSVLDPADKATALRSIEAEQRRREAEARAASAEWRAGQVSDLEIAVSRGEAGYREIEAAYEQGVLSASQRTRLTLRADGLIEEQQEVADDLARVDSVFAAGTVLDPKSTDDREAVNRHFRAVSSGWADLPPQDVAQRTADYVAQTGIVPDVLRGQIRGALRSGTEDQKIAAADLVDRIATTRPAALEDFAQEDIALGTTISTLIRSGVPAEEAVRQAEESVMNADAPEREIRANRLSEEDLVETALEDFRGEYDPILPFVATEVPDAMAGEFSRVYEAAYLSTGSEDAAYEMARSAMARTWAVTSVGGESRLMKYAPEALYGVLGGSEDSEWMTAQLMTDVQAIMPDATAEQVTIAADARTARDETYPVMIRDENGVFSPLLDNGRPLRWRPVWTESARYQEIVQEAGEGVDEARAEHDATMREREARRNRIEGVQDDMAARERMRVEITGE